MHHFKNQIIQLNFITHQEFDLPFNFIHFIKMFSYIDQKGYSNYKINFKFIHLLNIIYFNLKN